ATEAAAVADGEAVDTVAAATAMAAVMVAAAGAVATMMILQDTTPASNGTSHTEELLNTFLSRRDGRIVNCYSFCT
ncbi:hypothetical protein ACR2V8_26840, partial [Klebsiella pneumoniae]